MSPKGESRGSARVALITGRVNPAEVSSNAGEVTRAPVSEAGRPAVMLLAVPGGWATDTKRLHSTR